jgi:hypothetical protein
LQGLLLLLLLLGLLLLCLGWLQLCLHLKKYQAVGVEAVGVEDDVVAHQCAMLQGLIGMRVLPR